MRELKVISSKVGIICAVVASFAACHEAKAALSFTSSVNGGAFAGENYATFDGLTLGNAGGTDGGLTVSFVPDSQAVQGTTSQYATPFLLGNNNNHFGALYNGADTTPYLTSGSNGSVTGASTVLSFASSQNYLGLLWGSVDAYNTLSFYNNNVLVGSLTGAQVIANANGNQGATGSTYVNITGLTFNQVVASSTSYAFEFDNVAYGTCVPEPSTMISGALMLLPFGACALRVLRKNRAA